MAATKITSKGQITLPKVVRDRMGLRPGDRIEFVEEDGVYRLRKVVGESPFAKWRGYLKHLEGQDPDALVREMRGD